MKVISTMPGEKEFALFAGLPSLLYDQKDLSLRQDDRPDPENLAACFVLMDKSRPAARLAVYHNPGLKLNGKSAATVGNYECVKNSAASGLLLRHACEFAKDNGAGSIIGPMNGSTWNNYRFCTDKTNPPFLLEPWQHEYYNQQFLDNGFKIIATYLTSLETTFECDDEATLRREKIFISEGVNFRSLKKDDFETELEKLFPFLSEAFSENFLYTPISYDSFCDKYRKAFSLIHPELTILAEDRSGKVSGLVFCYDDPLSRYGKRLVVKTIARNPSFRYAGMGNVLANMVIRRSKTMGYRSVLHALMHEKAASLNLSKRFKGEVYRKYALYGKQI